MSYGPEAPTSTLPPPPGPPLPLLPPPSPPEPPRRRGLFGWVQRKPRLAFFVTLAVSLLAGVAIGGATGVAQQDLDEANERAAALEDRASAAESRGDELSRDLTGSRERVAELNDRIATLTAKGEVPALVGEDVDDARSDDAIGAYDWKVRTVEQISGETPGTVIAQSPREGTTLKAGRSITLTVAKKAPPKPRQWVTIFARSGGGQERTDEFRIPSGVKARVRYTFGGDVNDTLFLKTIDEGSDDFGDMLVNEIGPHSGESRLYGKGGGEYYLEIDGGSWTVEVQVFKRPE